MPDGPNNITDYRYYEPQYFKFSETYRAWVKLFISDCFALRQLDGFEGTRARFWKNHPIRWIQLVGVVTGVNIRPSHVAIELDDGSGACISLYVKGDVAETIHVDFDHNSCAIDVGHLIRVKGTLANDFKSDLQMVVDKIERLHDARSELSAWQERIEYRVKVLDVPWVCKVEAIGSNGNQEKARVHADGHDKATAAHRAIERTRKKEMVKQTSIIDLPSLDCRQHTQRNLKIVFLQYFSRMKVRQFTLRQLRASPELEAAAVCVTQHTISTKQSMAGIKSENESAPRVNSSQRYRTMNACLAELVQDGSIVPLEQQNGTFAVVGKWNLGKLMRELMQEMFAHDANRAEVTVREMWQAVRQAGRGFDSISKQMVQKVLAEMQADAEVLANAQNATQS